MGASFRQFDTNGDGFIRKDEFLQAYRSLHKNKKPAEVDELASTLFNKADLDGNGKINFNEWCTATVKD